MRRAERSRAVAAVGPYRSERRNKVLLQGAATHKRKLPKRVGRIDRKQFVLAG